MNKEYEALKLKENEYKDKLKENENNQIKYTEKENELNNKILSLEKQIDNININNDETKNKNGILEDENNKIRNEKKELNKKYI